MFTSFDAAPMYGYGSI